MRILIDTNVLIPLEPTAPEEIETGTRAAAELLRHSQQGGHTVLIHPASLEELSHDPNSARRAMRATLAEKYPSLERPPEPDEEFVEAIGTAVPGSHDWFDDRLLAAVSANAVDYLVSEDGGVHRKAKRLGIQDRVVTVGDAVELLRTLFPQVPVSPPAVESMPAHSLDEEDAIFDSVRAEYPGFDDWLARCKREGRRAWVVPAPNGGYAAVCIVKDDDPELSAEGRALKICTFKVSDVHLGNRYGELLLKTLFRYIAENRYDVAFVTVFEHHGTLIGLFEDFGFRRRLPDRPNGEAVYVKRFRPAAEDTEVTEPLAFHIAYGPPALLVREGRTYIVPILPEYHRMLFPDAEGQLQLETLADPRPFGNAIRKAYLCHSNARRLQPGDTLLFYKSQDMKAVTCVGVVEATLVSRDAEAVARFVGQRTVYSLEAIQRLCADEVLAILFRQDRVLRDPVSDDELMARRAMLRAPQSIQRIREEAFPWLPERVDA